MVEHSESACEPTHNLDVDRPSSAQPSASSQAETRVQPPQSNVALSEHERAVHTIAELCQGDEGLGFIGQISEISWVHSTMRLLVGAHTRNLQGTQKVVGQHSIHVEALNYFMEESDLHTIKGDIAGARKWPSVEISMLLSDAYFHAVAGTFSFMHRSSFFQSLTNFPRNRPVLSLSESRWLTAANLIWAIGTKWLQLANLDKPTECHETYYARARVLGLEHMELVEKPDIGIVRAMGLLAFYLFINGSIDR
jgi:hypothetical protein